MKNGKEKILKVVANMAYAVSKKEADSACKWLYYQPKLPEKVMELKNVRN